MEFQKFAIADQVANVRKRMRTVTSTAIQSVNRSPCSPGLLFFGLKPRGPFHSDPELWDVVSLTLRDPPRSRSLNKPWKT